MELCDRSFTDPYSTAPTILLIGKTGSGKSTFANALIGEKKFQASESPESRTQICQSTLINLNGQEYNLVDTPGIPNVRKPDYEVLGEIARPIGNSSRGIMVILYVMALSEYKEEEQIATDLILKFLDQEESYRHIIVIFTKCNKKQTEDRSLIEDSFNDKLESFLEKVGNRWVVSPNPEIFEPNDPVLDLHVRKYCEIFNHVML
ncbi:hypothetical protein GLOIN_2v1579400 [Rhizophagus clarus]|uniref:AIG1-type G domain-containing protein n=1 Tax=Rhizophagus clarus TaxID=94130 RepID=A0A8H3L017_9GLOM|nr:hypothetical protein GLOIN_2v1579400 [Rhizophagus clarus]